MGKRFVSEAIEPDLGSMDARETARGAPGMPSRFTWRRKPYAVRSVVDMWRETSSCKSGSDEQYARKHWFRILTTTGEEMEIYFERQARSKRERKMRWWLYTVTIPDSENPANG